MMCDIFAGISEHDNEGRVITAEFDDFYLVTACKCQGLKIFWNDTKAINNRRNLGEKWKRTLVNDSQLQKKLEVNI